MIRLILPLVSHTLRAGSRPSRQQGLEPENWRDSEAPDFTLSHFLSLWRSLSILLQEEQALICCCLASRRSLLCPRNLPWPSCTSPSLQKGLAMYLVQVPRTSGVRTQPPVLSPASVLLPCTQRRSHEKDVVRGCGFTPSLGILRIPNHPLSPHVAYEELTKKMHNMRVLS